MSAPTRSRPSPCSSADHEAVKADTARWTAELVHHRPWLSIGAELADCPRCKSTLVRAVPVVDTSYTPATAVPA